jgi:CIC family chloride channel protein
MGGLAGVVFHILLSFTLATLYGTNDIVTTLNTYPWWVVVLLPAMGGLLTGLLVVITRTPEIAGEGIPAIKIALEKQQSVVRYRVALLKTTATIATISTGGSAGREGPIVQIGSALGSMVAQLAKVPHASRETLLLAGAAAAMAATFGTPAAALVFVVEVLRRPMTLWRVILLGTAVVCAMVIARGVFSYQGLPVPVPTIITLDTNALFLAAVVGVVAGLVAVCFTYTLKITRTVSNQIVPQQWLRPAVGGLLVGVLLVWLPMLHEAASYQFGTDLTNGISLPVGFLIIVLGTKIVATALTVGTGGSGGIFAPSLILGVMVGAIVQSGAEAFGLQISTQLLLVGMAAVFAGAAHAPITAVFMVYELADTTALLPSLIIACVIAYVTARAVTRQHIYSVHT